MAQGETSYVLSGSSYQPLSQQPQSSQSSAYSALSASLASLKSRLSARGVSLPENNSPASLYSSSASGYSLSEAQPPSSQHTQPQPTYLSLTSGGGQQEHPYGSAYNQSNDNKTIVLAIPAKINFLTDSGKAPASPYVVKPPQMQQQAPQMAVLQPATNLQPSSYQQPVADYSGKQIGKF